MAFIRYVICATELRVLGLFVLVLALFFFPPRAVAAPPATYTNPILLDAQDCGADPHVLLDGDTYYYYASHVDPYVFISKDLVHWSKGPKVLPDKFKNVWGPPVYRHTEDGKFYMYYILKLNIGVAVADRPEGLFRDLGLLVVGVIDSEPFRDDDGRLYLYVAHPTGIYCIPMKSPTETGGPVAKCFGVSQDWERHTVPLVEGPTMIKHNGTYYLLYSGSAGYSRYYAIGYATAPTPIGPFTKYPGNPVFQDLGHNIYGPGHGSLTRDRAGQIWHLYHQKGDAKDGWTPRDICLDPVYFDDRGLLRGKATRGVAQPVPSCDPNLVWSPDIHPRGAVFNKQVFVSLTSETVGAQIRYTRDGTDPCPTSPLYERPFGLSETTTVKARAFKPGLIASATSASRFTRTDTPLPENPSPGTAPGHSPFQIFTTPNLHWQPPGRKYQLNR